MSEAFKINIHFDEKGEELEEIIKKLIINSDYFNINQKVDYKVDSMRDKNNLNLI